MVPLPPGLGPASAARAGLPRRLMRILLEAAPQPSPEVTWRSGGAEGCRGRAELSYRKQELLSETFPEGGAEGWVLNRS